MELLASQMTNQNDIATVNLNEVENSQKAENYGPTSLPPITRSRPDAQKDTMTGTLLQQID